MTHLRTVIGAFLLFASCPAPLLAQGTASDVDPASTGVQTTVMDAENSSK